MNVSYDHYRIFYYVARYGSFTRAAAALFSNQPNVTRAIRVMEAELGCRLFRRTNRGAALTAEGEALYAHVAQAFEHIRAGEEELAQAKERPGGTLTVAATEIALRSCLLPYLGEFRRRYPSVKLRISNLSAPEAVGALKAGEAELSVVTTPIEEDGTLCVHELMHFSDAAVCGEAYRERLTGRMVSLGELAEYPLISLCHGSASYTLYSALFATHGLPFSPDIAVATTDLIPPLVRNGLGVGFLPESSVDKRPGILRINIAESLPQRSICAVTVKDRPLAIHAKALLALLP